MIFVRTFCCEILMFVSFEVEEDLTGENFDECLRGVFIDKPN